MTQVILINPQQAHQAVTALYRDEIKHRLICNPGVRLELLLREAENEKTVKQRGYYHKCVLTEIAESAVACGKRYPMPIWKEYFRDKYLGFRIVTTTNPMTSRKLRRRVRVSTEDLGVRAYSKLIDQVSAFAATELGVTFSVRNWMEWGGVDVDPETGEIIDPAMERAA